MALPFSAGYRLLMLMLVCFRFFNLTPSQVSRFVFGPCLRSTCQVPFSLDPPPLWMTAFLKGCDIVLSSSLPFGVVFLLFLFLVSFLWVRFLLRRMFCSCSSVIFWFSFLSVSSWHCYALFLSVFCLDLFVFSCVCVTHTGNPAVFYTS